MKKTNYNHKVPARQLIMSEFLDSEISKQARFLLSLYQH
ncbi:hypothetical protein SPPR111872_04320 [Sphingobacterium prati]